MKWIPANKLKIEYQKKYYAKWPSGTVIKSTGWFQQSDGTFFWHEQGYIPILKREHEQLLILDESQSDSEAVGGLLKALTDISKWDDELSDTWDDPGYRAIAALKEYKLKSKP